MSLQLKCPNCAAEELAYANGVNARKCLKCGFVGSSRIFRKHSALAENLDSQKEDQDDEEDQDEEEDED